MIEGDCCMNHNIGRFIAKKRKELGLTQQKLAEKLNVSFQAVSKWENGTSIPDTLLLTQLACVLKTSVDTLVGYKVAPVTEYEKKYNGQDYYWGITPNRLCYEVMKLKPPVKPYRVLDIGCGEGKDAVFLAKNGYIVSAFDAAKKGLEKARELAQLHHVDVNFYQANINEYELVDDYDIIYSSGVFHYLTQNKRKQFVQSLKEHTTANGIHALNVFVEKPFIEAAPDREEAEQMNEPWYSGELMGYYHDWVFYEYVEEIFDCSSGGIPHKHCMDRMIAEKFLG